MGIFNGDFSMGILNGGLNGISNGYFVRGFCKGILNVDFKWYL